MGGELAVLLDLTLTLTLTPSKRHNCAQDELISKAFSGRDGKAYLFHSAINIIVGQSEDRNLLTGMHTVADMRCKGCQTVVGWTYLKAWEGSQKYKEGE